jgi:uroporphyrinogen-III synthase
MSLKGMNVLVTRPLTQGEGLQRLITEQGGKASLYPVMDIVGIDTESDPTTSQQCKQFIMNLDEFQHIIFVSTNAVKYGLQWIDQYWAQLPVEVNWYGIGKSTNSQLVLAGIPVTTEFGSTGSGSMNSEALLERAELQELEHQKVLIIRGVGGRDYLANQLKQRGARVSVAECYRRKLVNKKIGEITEIIQQQNINTVCVNSGESLHNFCQLAGESALTSLEDLMMVVPGTRVADIARNSGFKNVIIAENASDESVLSALKANNS